MTAAFAFPASPFLILEDLSILLLFILPEGDMLVEEKTVLSEFTTLMIVTLNSNLLKENKKQSP